MRILSLKTKDAWKHAKETQEAARPQRPQPSTSQSDCSPVHQGELEQARDALRAILQRDRNDVEALSLLAMAASGLEDLQSMWFAMTRMAIQRPDDADTWFHAAMACYVNMLPFSALHYGTEFLSRFPDHPEADEIRNFMPRIEALCETIREEYGIAAGQSDDGLMLFEEGRLLLEQGYYKEGRRVSEMAAKLAPDAAPPLNNLSLSYMIEGKLERALEITEQVLERFPGNLHAQTNRMQFLLRLGRRGEAQKIAGRLRTLEPESADDWHKLIEAFTYLGDDGMVVALHEDLQKVTDGARAADSPLIQHWAAVAYSRRGDDKQARKLWQKALKSLPDFPVVEENLAELKKPAGERAKAWPFAFQQWVPRVWIEEFLHIAMTEYSENVLTHKIQQVFERNPALAASIPILLERGDASGREFALRAAIILDLPVLAEFALSDQGTDEERLRAAQAAAEAGLLPRGRAVQMWNKGKLTEMILMAYEIHEEPPLKRPPHRVRTLIQRAFDAQMNAEFEDSLKLIDEALRRWPSHLATPH